MIRLIDTRTLEFYETSDESIPYAILSHTRGSQEVSYQKMLHRNNQIELKSGLNKIRGFCNVAASRGFSHAWVDTCCIDKTNLSELPEAINSMYRWYGQSKLCFVYLDDVKQATDPHGPEVVSIRKSKWFTRGWTLQELIAPHYVELYSSRWEFITSKHSWASSLSKIKNIDERVLLGGQLGGCSVAQKMSWASGRVTTRPEDLAYCLMGNFDVNMPLLYGEGSRAFLRLQEEIMKSSDDHSLFAWDATHLRDCMPSGWCSLFAPSPMVFDPRVERLYPSSGLSRFSYLRQPFTATNMGVRITLPVLRTMWLPETITSAFEHPPCDYAVLDCHLAGHPICIPIEPVSMDEARYRRGKKRNRMPFDLKENICDVREIYVHSSHLAVATSNDDFGQALWSNKVRERRRLLNSMNHKAMSFLRTSHSFFILSRLHQPLHLSLVVHLIIALSPNVIGLLCNESCIDQVHIWSSLGCLLFVYTWFY